MSIKYDFLNNISVENAQSIIPYLSTQEINEVKEDLINSYSVFIEKKQIDIKQYLPTHLICFFSMCSVEQLKSVSDIFKEKKHDPYFAGLILVAKDASYDYSEKLDLLLSWGYNVNISLGETPYQKMFTNYSANANALHICSSIKSLKVLINYGIDASVKCVIGEELKKFKEKTKLSKISNMIQYKVYLSYFKENYNDFSLSEIIECLSNEKILAVYSGRVFYDKCIKRINRLMQHCDKASSAYEQAVANEQKAKALLLKDIIDVNEKNNWELKQYDAIKGSNSKNKIILLKNAIKTDNAMVLKNLNKLYLSPESKFLVFSYAIKGNNETWVKYMLENAIIVPNPKSEYLYYAYKQKRASIFSYLYENGYKHGIDKVVKDIEESIVYYKKYMVDINKLLSVSIVSYLMKQGHFFDEPKIIEKFVKSEKTQLKSAMQTISEQKKDRKFLKL